MESLSIGKILPEDDEAFQYILAKPVNYYYLLNILTHILKGLKLCNESSSSSSPLKGQVRASTPPVENSPPPADGSLQVLLADDNDFCRNAVVRLMQKFDTNISACDDGGKALRKFVEQEGKFDLGVFDYQMPAMNGIELIEKVREFEHDHCLQSPMPIICISFFLSAGGHMKQKIILVLSGDNDEDVSQQAKDAGANFICNYFLIWRWFKSTAQKSIVKKPLYSTDLEEVFEKLNLVKPIGRKNMILHHCEKSIKI